MAAEPRDAAAQSGLRTREDGTPSAPLRLVTQVGGERCTVINLSFAGAVTVRFWLCFELWCSFDEAIKLAEQSP
jgi:hypothetical protein